MYNTKLHRNPVGVISLIKPVSSISYVTDISSDPIFRNITQPHINCCVSTINKYPGVNGIPLEFWNSRKPYPRRVISGAAISRTEHREPHFAIALAVKSAKVQSPGGSNIRQKIQLSFLPWRFRYQVYQSGNRSAAI